MVPLGDEAVKTPAAEACFCLSSEEGSGLGRDDQAVTVKPYAVVRRSDGFDVAGQDARALPGGLGRRDPPPVPRDRNGPVVAVGDGVPGTSAAHGGGGTDEPD